MEAHIVKNDRPISNDLVGFKQMIAFKILLLLAVFAFSACDQSEPGEDKSDKSTPGLQQEKPKGAAGQKNHQPGPKAKAGQKTEEAQTSAAQQNPEKPAKKKKYRKIYCKQFDKHFLVLPGVLWPDEAEARVLPYMKNHPEMFKDKLVMDIGAGSGVIGLYAAYLGARRVIATDIDPKAIESANLNAKRFGLDSIYETRLVPLTDMSAYSVIQDDEVFDVIISNPPFTLDLEADKNDIYVDKGDLGFSIVRGLKDHLAPDGAAVLFYGALFYHQVMVKFARFKGYKVEQEDPDFMTPWERDILFNSYLKRLLKREKMNPNAFRFNWQEEPEKWRPVLDEHMKETHFKGIMVIRHK